MEGGLVQHRRENTVVGRVNVNMMGNKVIRKRSKVKKRIKRLLPICVALQELYACCRSVFNGPPSLPPSLPPHHVHALSRILDSMEPKDVGLSRDIQFFNTRNPHKENPRVICTTIYECPNFSLVLFFLPPSAVIPLHNHPGMTVFSKLLLGTMHIKSYDWVDGIGIEQSKRPSNSRLARLQVDGDFTAPCRTSVLYPNSGGNIHSFTAITPCVVLDVLGPPYSKEEGRDCSYYKDYQYNASSGKQKFADGEMVKAEEGGQYWWLEEIEVPEDSQMDRIEYLGPPIIETSC
ncbi:hypothetical protein Nepgr_024856 [Nepenthes gracilis]|uniref:cysteine dioxygenase n=1 Tax=Nepenthes gracilis TaxID=150966 RepID=A0AAD3T3M4_NEPGR|nr:hypothetical protein Nepgr_024856 [Nepenthes gracilis]